MKKLSSILSLVALSFAIFAISVQAQTALTSTTLAAAVGTGTQTIPVASATGINASQTSQTVLFIDHEAMFVNSINGTSVRVFRGYSGTPVEAHLSGATVLLGPPNAFNPLTIGIDANGDPFGSCTAANTLYTPYVNVKNGRQWLCSTVTLNWVPGWGNPSTPAGVTTLVASANGAVLPTGPLFHMNGTSTITSFTVPLGFPLKSGAGFCVIPDAAYQTTAGNNIGTTTTATANRVQCWTYDVNAGKFFASY